MATDCNLQFKFLVVMLASFYNVTYQKGFTVTLVRFPQSNFPQVAFVQAILSMSHDLIVVSAAGKRKDNSIHGLTTPFACWLLLRTQHFELLGFGEEPSAWLWCYKAWSTGLHSKSSQHLSLWNRLKLPHSWLTGLLGSTGKWHGMAYCVLYVLKCASQRTHWLLSDSYTVTKIHDIKPHT